MEKEQKKTRDREANWDPVEKDYLRKCVNRYYDIIENKGNETSIVVKKKNSWEAIRATMVSAGYDREVPKLKAQWVRMKVNAKKAVANTKQVSLPPKSSVQMPELIIEDNIVQGKIKQEYNDDIINSNYIEKNECVQSPIGAEHSEDDFDINKDNTNTTQQDYLDTDNHQQCHADNIGNNTEYSTPTKLQRLKNLPKTASKNSVILERQRQIVRESLNSEEINKLQKKQLTAENEHLQRMHELEEMQQKELHALKLQHLQRQIDHAEELHALKLEILRKMAASNQTSKLDI